MSFQSLVRKGRDGSVPGTTLFVKLINVFSNFLELKKCAAVT